MVERVSLARTAERNTMFPIHDLVSCSFSDKPPCVSNTGGYKGYQGYVNYPGYPSYQPQAAPSFQPQVVPTSPRYVMTAAPAKDGKAVPVKARPTAEHASTRKMSSGNQTGRPGALSQTKDLISDADEFTEYNGTEQSFAGYSYKQNEEKFYNSSIKHEDDKSAFPGNDSTEKNDKKESEKREQTSSDEPDYKDEIEKEAVEQEKEADRKAEEEGDHHDDNDEDEDEDEEDEDDEDEQNDDDDDDPKEAGHSENNNTMQKDDINNPAEQTFAVSPTVLPGMCPPCRE